MKTVLALIIYLLIFTLPAESQFSINSGGSNAEQNEGSLSYSVGQVFYSMSYTQGFYSNEGVEQPREITRITHFNDKLYREINIQVYPNPASNHIFLEIDHERPWEFSYKLINISGTVILEKRIQSTLTEIPIDRLSPSPYLLNIFHNEILYTNYRVIKY